MRPSPSPPPAAPQSLKRTPLAALLFALFRPAQARTVLLHPDRLEFLFASRHAFAVPLGDVERLDLTHAPFQARLRFLHSAGATALSGLSRVRAAAFARALERAREEWWRRTLAQRLPALQPLHERIRALDQPSRYVDSDAFGRLVRDAGEAAGGLAARWPPSLSEAPEIGMLRDVLAFLDAPDGARDTANRAYLDAELARCREFLDRVEARPLTQEQRKAVAVDERRNLVVAAAGSGKTSVIVAKAGWLVNRRLRKPSEILLLAFARDARNEMEARVRARLGPRAAAGIAVHTFHELGMRIIGEAEGKRPSLSPTAEDDTALSRLIRGILAELLDDGAVSRELLDWFQGQFAPYRSRHDFDSWGAYLAYIRAHDIRSLAGEKVKSFEECEIANHLYLNAIPYEYEAPYEHETATPSKRQYKPDFHLPLHGIYIEHFGLDAQGNPPPYVDRNKYLNGIEWKRQLHASRGTVLIETFSHERAAGVLLPSLDRKLAAHGVTLRPLSGRDVFAILADQGRIDPFVSLVGSFLQHYKGGLRSISDLPVSALPRAQAPRARAFLAVFRHVLDRYEDALRSAGEIDFNDMIARATKHVEAARWRSPYGYVLVDEFQDISPGRARLLQALLDAVPAARLFAVGDDWQAIYRFGGSDIAVMREFQRHFGAFARIDLETTFRCPPGIAAIATDFVLRNPAQLTKTVRAARAWPGPAVHVGLPAHGAPPLLPQALERIAADAARAGGTADVLLLGRYNRLKPNLKALGDSHPTLRLRYMTIHRAKGLEADYAVVLGLSAGRFGFPLQIADDPLLDLVLSAPEAHPNAEERRLLYVALTRARRQVYLLAGRGTPSPFVTELLDRDSHDVAVFGRPPEADAPCPVCEGGRLERRENATDKSAFWGCSNWPWCEHTRPACPKCLTGLPVRDDGGFRCRDCRAPIEACPACPAGILVPRMGRRGRFLGCSRYPACDYTRDLGRARTDPR